VDLDSDQRPGHRDPNRPGGPDSESPCLEQRAGLLAVTPGPGGLRREESLTLPPAGQAATGCPGPTRTRDAALGAAAVMPPSMKRRSGSRDSVRPGPPEARSQNARIWYQRVMAAGES
jgi:hypothetical protein